MRLIPTYAGNTDSEVIMSSTGTAHPHVCGEHLEIKAAGVRYFGSSPRMRGTPGEFNCGFCIMRLIPTYAGNTLTCSLRVRRLPAHPHVCGEHPLQHPPVPAVFGSSPRMRGTPAASAQNAPETRLIPTYAGNTPVVPDIRDFSAAHPHVCGEHTHAVPHGSGEFGSSPRMRGTLQHDSKCIILARLIPTYAGNTWE